MESDFESKQFIGDGCFGDVYRVMCTQTSTEFAVKNVVAKEKEENRFIREVQIMRLLNHPNIIRLLDAWWEKRSKV